MLYQNSVQRRWAGRAALLLAAIVIPAVRASTSAFGLAPDHIPIGEETSVSVSDTLAEFDLQSPASTYVLAMQWTNGTAPANSEAACSVVSTSMLRCLVTWMVPGAAVVKVKANGILLHTDILWFYAPPTVASFTPTKVPLGGGKVHLKFASAIKRFGPVVLRFQDPVTSTHVDTSLTVADQGGSASGRSPHVPKFSNSTVARVLLSLNGVSFSDTGLTTAFVQNTKLKIGFLYVEDPSDFGWTFQHNIGRLKLEELFFGLIETFYAAHVPEWGPNECDFCSEEPGWNASKKMGMWNDEPPDYFGVHRASMIIKKWVEEEGVKMIIGTSFYYQWDIYHMSNRYPNIPMIHATGWLTRDNMAVAFPKVYQARYLSGIAIAWYIKKNNLPKRVGYLSSFELGETVRAINAFKLGMEQVDPEIEIYLTWLFTWFDARKERLGATRLVEFYDITALAQHTDSREPQIVMSEFKKVGVGYNTDMLLTVGDSVLTSPVLVWSALYAPLVQKVLDGEALGGANLWDGLETGAWRLSDYSSNVPAEATLQIEEEQKKFQNGIDDIFCRKDLTDTKGRVRNGPVNPAVDPVPWEADHLIPGTTCLAGNVVNQVCQKYVNFDQCAEFWYLEGIYQSCEPSPSKPEGITSPKLKNGECFLGAMDIPDQCPDGTYLTLLGCTKVPAGSYSRAEKVTPCPPGFAAPLPGATACTPCLPGTAASSEGFVECLPCKPGNYSAKSGTITCSPCYPGTYMELEGQEECKRCDLASYSSTEGSTSCTKCPGSLTTQWKGARKLSDCGCAEGSYRSAIDRMQCEPCLEGMSCGFGADAANFGKMRLLAQTQDATDMHVIPLLKTDYFTEVERPLYVFECLQHDACPGGKPGQCSNGRVGLVCALCPDGTVLSENICSDCQPVDKVLVFIIVIAFMFGLAFVYVVSNGRVKNDASNAEAMSVAAGMVVTIIQLLASFNQLPLPWPSGVGNLLGGFKFIIFDPGSIAAECIFGSDAGVRYLLRVIVPFLMVFLVFFLYGSSKLCCLLLRGKSWVLNKALNTIGQVSQMLFIAFAAIAATAFQCYSHPNGDLSIVIYPEVICGSADHTPIIFLAVVLIVIFIVPFLGLSFWGNISAPSESFKPASAHLVRYRFLFYRFRPRIWWWGSVVAIRQLLLAFSPMIEPDDPHAQIIFIVCVLFVYICAVCYFWPWKGDELNLVETTSLVCLALFIVTAGAFVAPTPKNTAYAAIMAVMLIIIVVVLGFVIVVAGMGLLQSGCSSRFGDTGLFGMQYRASQEERNQFAKQFHHLCVPLASLEPEQLSQLLLFMSSYDRRRLQETISIFYSLNTKVLCPKKYIPAKRISNIPSVTSTKSFNKEAEEKYWDEVSQSIAQGHAAHEHKLNEANGAFGSKPSQWSVHDASGFSLVQDRSGWTVGDNVAAANSPRFCEIPPPPPAIGFKEAERVDIVDWTADREGVRWPMEAKPFNQRHLRGTQMSSLTTPRSPRMPITPRDASASSPRTPRQVTPRSPR